MTAPGPPERPKVYHITHVDNLAGVCADGCLHPDREMSTRPETIVIGMGTIKGRRLTLPVRCHPGDHVGDYVPFYFCPRSIMLYLIYCANHRELTYRGGQGPIVHLEVDLHAAIEWAELNDRRWAFTLSNAGANYAEFRASIGQLDELDWLAISARDWKAADVREGKQAEFLVHGAFPFSLVSRIGVRSEGVRQRVNAALASVENRPAVDVKPDWYY